MQKIIDLTHTLSKDIPSWDKIADFNLSLVTDYKDCVPPDLFRIEKISASLSLGTHIDSPAHVIPGGRTVDKLKINELIVDCVVINVSKKTNKNYEILPADIEEFENKHGKIKPKNFIIFFTGWSRHWKSPEKYHNEFFFPSVNISTAEILLKKDVVGIGIDTFSCDTGKKGFPVHNAVLGADKYLVENIANADKLPPVGSKIFILPTKLKNATEAPIRLVALL